MKQKKKKIQKGDFGYISSQKKRRLALTLVLFAIPLLIFFTGLIHTKTRNNLLTVVALLGCLPACKCAVGMIMMWMQKPMKKEVYEKIAPHAGSLVMSYEMCLTTYEKTQFIDAFAVCGGLVVGYADNPKEKNMTFMEEHVQKILRSNGYKEKVRIFTELKPFLERLEYMNSHREELNENIRFTPDEDHPELSRDEMIKNTILAISL